MKSKALFILVLSSFFIFSSCTKSKEAKLEGQWKKIEVANLSSPQPTTIWEFKSGELIVSQIPVGTTSLIEKSRVKYSLGFNGSQYTLDITQKISGQDLDWIQANGKIVQLNDDYLKWFNKNGYYGEFVRYN
ncbi:MAG: hypothetical protein WCP69_13270 [Bacteroidota bacterium]|jgi:hypothetical protein